MNNPKNPRRYGDIPIHAAVVAAYIFRRGPNGAEYLLLKRSSRYMFGLWQHVAGSIEEGENAVDAVIRELREETGQTPIALYSADIIESFYDTKYNVIMMVPIFVAEFDSSLEVVLSNEHSEYKWVSAAEAMEHFTFPQQKSSLELIEREFVLKSPPAILAIEF
jgi:dihydroneopterin triphosphate diphosphatase